MILQFFSNIFKTKDVAPLSSSISTLQVILLLLWPCQGLTIQDLLWSSQILSLSTLKASYDTRNFDTRKDKYEGPHSLPENLQAVSSAKWFYFLYLYDFPWWEVAPSLLWTDLARRGLSSFGGNEAPPYDHLPARRGSSVFTRTPATRISRVWGDRFSPSCLRTVFGKWFSADRFYL